MYGSDPVREPSDAREDLISRLAPDHGLRVLIVHVEKLANRELQGGHAAMRPAAELFGRECREPAFDEIEPRGRGRRDVQMETGRLANHRWMSGGVCVLNVCCSDAVNTNGVFRRLRATCTSCLREALLHEDPVWGGALLVTLRRSHTTGLQSKVHPTYKTKYRVANWPAYNQALVRRGDVTVWLSSEAIAAWTPGRSGRQGGQRRYSDLAIETALTLRLLYHLPLRQAEGFLHALFGMMRLDLSAPDYTTLSRRSQHLRRRLRPVPPGESIHLVHDSTGLSIVGEGEWAAAKHGGRGRRGWRKLHLGVDQSGVIRVHTLTEETGDDATTALDLLTAVEGPLVRVTADAAYDTVAVYEMAGARGATVVVPPARTANVPGHGPRSPARDRTITLVKQLGRRQWKKASGYHRQSRVENTFFRYKSIIGDGLRARSPAGQGSEVVLGCEILNRLTELGRPVSYRIGQ